MHTLEENHEHPKLDNFPIQEHSNLLLATYLFDIFHYDILIGQNEIEPIFVGT